MAKPFFEIVGPGFLNMWAPSRKWGGASNLLEGKTETRLRLGEFLELGDNCVVRGSTNPSALPSFAYFSETGRGDIVTGGKVPVLMHAMYEADTSLVARTAAGLIDHDDSGAASAFTIGDALTVTDIYAPDDLSHKVYRGLRKASTLNGTQMVVGYVTRVFDDKIRFVYVLR